MWANEVACEANVKRKMFMNVYMDILQLCAIGIVMLSLIAYVAFLLFFKTQTAIIKSFVVRFPGKDSEPPLNVGIQNN